MMAARKCRNEGNSHGELRYLNQVLCVFFSILSTTTIDIPSREYAQSRKQQVEDKMAAVGAAGASTDTQTMVQGTIVAPEPRVAQFRFGGSASAKHQFSL
jgi:hypothetical protein